jgi:hypothetical protein
VKKKHRDIVVDGEKWAWFYEVPSHYKGCEESYRNLTIWKNKKRMFAKTYGRADMYYQEPKNYQITPGLIARFIKRFLKK